MKRVQKSKDFEELIQSIISSLQTKHNDFRKVILFGSRLNEKCLPDSDFDLVLLFTDKPDWKRENEILDLVYDIALEHNIVIDAKVYQEKEFQKQNTPFRAHVWQHGLHYGT